MFLCRIENLEQSNEGVYICRASGVYGQAQDTARLTIQGLLRSLHIHECTPSFIKATCHILRYLISHSPAEGDDQRAHLGADGDDRQLCGV